jgi:hypothetical protein
LSVGIFYVLIGVVFQHQQNLGSVSCEHIWKIQIIKGFLLGTMVFCT